MYDYFYTRACQLYHFSRALSLSNHNFVNNNAKLSDYFQMPDLLFISHYFPVEMFFFFYWIKWWSIEKPSLKSYLFFPFLKYKPWRPEKFNSFNQRNLVIQIWTKPPKKQKTLISDNFLQENWLIQVKKLKIAWIIWKSVRVIKKQIITLF